MNIKNLIERLKSATYRNKGDNYDYHILSNANAELVVIKIVSEWAAEQISDNELSRKCAELEAKCYAYEKFIANSNFAPMVQDKQKEERKSRWVVRKPMTDGKNYEVQCEICGHTAAVIVGADSYEKALEQFQLWLMHDEGNTFTRCCSSCGARMEGSE